MRKKVLDILSNCFVGFSDPCIFNSNLKTCLHAIFDHRTSRIPFEVSTQWTIYSATIFLEKCRKVVQEKQFEKSGSRKVVDQKKRWFYTINPHFFWLEKSGSANSDYFLVGKKWLTRKENPILQNHYSTLFQKSGCRLNG